MFNFLNLFFQKKVLGIDIGTSAIKVVEISRYGQGKRLENYGEIASDVIYKQSAEGDQGPGNLFSRDVVVAGIKAILDEAKITTKKAVFSIPDFFTFCTSFEMPPMPEEEISGAIYYNASQYITLPINEVVLDWRIIKDPSADKNTPLKIFLVAVPSQVVEEYKTIARLLGLDLHSIESEVFGIARSLGEDASKTVCLVDIGVQSSTINIIDRGVLKKSYSFNFYSAQLAQSLSTALGVELPKAESIKNTEGFNSERRGVKDALGVLLNPLISEIRSASAEFLQTHQRPVEEIYLTGGTANLPGLKEYLQENLKKSVVVPNCFADFLYPPVLEESLREMNPRFSVAVGVAEGALN